MYHFREKQNHNLYTFDVQQVSKQYQQIAIWENQLLHRLENNDFLTLSYEALFNDYQTQVDAIRNFLNLAGTEVVTYSSLVKGNPDKLNTWVSNIKEIEESVQLLLSSGRSYE